MSRSLTEFVQSQWLDWKPSPLFPHLIGTHHKVLSKDDDSGEVTALVRYPAGWVNRNGPCLDHNEEVYVLDGKFEIDDVALPPDYYTYIPKGFPRSLSRSTKGAVALTFFTHETPTSEALDSRYQSFAHGMWVPRTNAFRSIWPAADDKMMATNAEDTFARRCDLRKDARTGSETMLFGFPPAWSIASTQIQNVATEFYLLAGTVTLNDRGSMTPGAYMCYGIGAERAAMSSREPAVFLVRSHDGPFGSKAGVDCDFSTPKPVSYNCIIPTVLTEQIVSGPYSKNV